MQVTCLKDIGNRWKMFEPKREAQDGKSEEDDLENRELGHEITFKFHCECISCSWYTSYVRSCLVFGPHG